MIDLLDDETAWITGARERCKNCGHLAIFHNQHCCSFCMVKGCGCEEDGEVPSWKREGYRPPGVEESQPDFAPPEFSYSKDQS